MSVLIGMIARLLRFRDLNCVLGIALVVSFAGCRRDNRTVQGTQIRTALTDLAAAEDIYYSANLRYSADQSLIVSLMLPRGLSLSIESADEHGWRAKATHQNGVETCYETGRNNGSSDLAVVEGPDCKPLHVSATLRDVRGRKIAVEDTAGDGAIVDAATTVASAPSSVSSSAPISPGDLLVLLPNTGQPAEDFGYPTQTVDRLAMRRLLAAKSYDALDRVLAAYGDSVLRDYRVEYRLFDAYAAFDVAVPPLEPLLTEWVRTRPKSPSARLARAMFYRALGWNARGYKLARETSREQFQRMGNFFRLSAADVDTALHLEPKSFAAYRQLIDLARAEGDVKSSRKFLDQGLKLQPNSFVLRMAYMLSILPRWGGSYEMMAQFADESAPYAKRNPRIASLKGFVDWDQGRRAESDGRNGDAIELYQRALQSGNLWEFRFQKAKYNSRADQNEDALQDLNSALVQAPQDADVLNERARVTYELGRTTPGEASAKYYSQAFRDVALAVQLDPADEDIREHLAFIQANIPEYAPPST